MYSVYCRVYIVHNMYSVYCRVYSVHTMYSVYCRVYSVHTMIESPVSSLMVLVGVVVVFVMALLFSINICP